MYEDQQQQQQQQQQIQRSPSPVQSVAAVSVSQSAAQEVHGHFQAMAEHVAARQERINALQQQVNDSAARLEQINQAKARAAAFTNGVENVVTSVMDAFHSGGGYVPSSTYSEADRQRDRAALDEYFQQNEIHAAASNAQKDADDAAWYQQQVLEDAAHAAQQIANRRRYADEQAAQLQYWAHEAERSKAEEQRKQAEHAAWVAQLTAPSSAEIAARSHPSAAYGRIQLKRLEVSGLESQMQAEERNVAQRVHDALKHPKGVDAVLANSASAHYLKVRGALSGARQELRRLPQDEFAAAPQNFLTQIIVSTEFDHGLKGLYPNLSPSLRAEFINAMDRWDRHWFTLAPDTQREQKGVPAFTLTPALEKYVAEFPDDGLLGRMKTEGRIVPASSQDAYTPTAYVPYRTGKPRADDFPGTIGNAHVRREPDPSGEEFSPDFVFTAGMNGCAFTVTEGADPQHFTAWHFQSPGSNRTQAEMFREEHHPSDWFGHDEYESEVQSGLYEATNLLWRSPEGWKVLSQETRYSHTDRSAVHGMKYTDRSLNTGPTDLSDGLPA
ncbi:MULTISPECIES: hypothetical protein [unclassified Streptomyces]|uniref:hypothetical protein n=1 Tax=unclassified Streptomyces TaxID=2593676 RepID=UPI0038086C35